MTKRNRSNCKYVEIFTHHVGSTDAPSRRTEFVRETNTKFEKSLTLRVGTR
jgi:hypothetical protein